MADATDDFNRANGGLGADWTTSPAFQPPLIVSNQATGTSAMPKSAPPSEEEELWLLRKFDFL